MNSEMSFAPQTEDRPTFAPPTPAPTPATPSEPLPTLGRPTLPPTSAVPSAGGQSNRAASPSIAAHLAMAPDGLTGAQMAAIEATQAANASGTKTPRRRSVTRVFMGFAVVAVFAAGLGVGARALWDKYEEASEGLPELGEGLPTHTFEHPEGSYIDTTIVAGSGDEKISTRVRQSLTSQQIDATVVLAGGELPATAVKIRDGRSSLQVVGGEPQPITDLDEATTPLIDAADVAASWVFTVDQVAPAEMLPFVRGLSEQDTTLRLAPIGPESNNASESTGEGDSVAAASPEGLDDVLVRQYRFDIDEAAFAGAEPLVYAEWARQFGSSGPLEIWVDHDGIVRQIAMVDEGDPVIIRLHALGSSLAGFSADFTGGSTYGPTVES